MSYVQGTVVRVSAPFTAAADGAPVEPAEVVLRIDKPGTEPTTELELTSGGVINDPAVAGGYYADLEISADLRRATSSAASFSFIVVDRKALAVRQRVGYQPHPRIVQCLARGERAERLASAVGLPFSFIISVPAYAQPLPSVPWPSAPAVWRPATYRRRRRPLERALPGRRR